MTEIQKMDAMDKKIDIGISAGWQCFNCGKHLRLSESQLAHRIPKAKMYLEAYGPEVIHHRLNMRLSCADCNSYALLDPATHPVEAAELVEKIMEDLK